MSDKEEKNKKIIKLLMVFLLIWSCLFLISGIGNVIRFSLRETPGLFQRELDAIMHILFFLFIYPLCGTIYSACLSKTDFKNSDSLEIFFVSASIVYAAGCLLGIIGYLDDKDGMLIVSGGICVFYCSVSLILTDIPAILLYVQTSTGKRALRKELRQDKQIQSECTQLLSAAGKRFFVKYFERLRDWNIADIVDIITENYSPQQKSDRIYAAKKIFQKHLEKTVLEQIIRNDSAIDEETRIKAQQLLENL